MALAQVFGDIGSLEEVHVSQNGIKDEGMAALLENLGARCKGLRVLRINDNWLKAKAAEKLLGLILNCQDSLELLNISDLNMGQEAVLVAIRALAQSNCVLETFQCNYNDVESKEVATECL